MSACKYCQATIKWGRVGDDWRPLEADGSAHRCRGKVKHVVGDRVIGAQYTPSCGGCAVPPWEVCACSERLTVGG